MKRFVSMLCAAALVLAVTFLLPMQTSAASKGDLTFTLNSDGESYYVSDCKTSASGALEIPATYNGKPVTSIGAWAFYNCTGLTSITIPDSVTSIEYGAFKGCTGLTSITIPDSVTSIGSSAFYNCTGLTSVSIGNGVTSIGDSAFYDCTGLTSVTIGTGITSIDEEAFYNCYSLVDVYIKDPNAWCKIDFAITRSGYASYSSNVPYSSNPLYYADNCHILDAKGDKVTELVLDNSVTNIPAYAFKNCKDLTSVIIPDSVTEIGTDAFSGCSGLTSITIPFVGSSIAGSSYPLGYLFGTSSYTGGVAVDQVRWSSDTSGYTYCCYIPASLRSVTVTGGTITRGAFYKCTGLTSITISDGVTSIGSKAFSGCTGLASITIPDSVTSIGDDAFYKCTGLTSVSIGNGVNSIGDDAFFDCTGLASIAIPGSVTSIGEYAFSNCNGLTDVYIPEPSAWFNISFGNISSNPLRYADNGHILDAEGKEVTELVLDNSVTTIPAYAFQNCKNLTGITIPGSVTSIGDYAFSGCTGLTDITIPDSITSIGNYVFSGCTGLTDITIPDSITSIGNYAFRGCTGLTDITIPHSITGIGNGMLFDCTGLTSITIPNSVRSIGDSAFSGCTGLTSITIPDSVTIIGGYAFYGCTGLTSITIPSSITGIGNGVFSHCTGLTSITIPDSVTIIGGYAFSGCTGLTSITIPNSVTSIGYYAFTGCTGLTSITIPNSVTSIGYFVFSGCTGLTSITIPDSVTSIGTGAFSGCKGLTSIIIPFVGASRSDTSPFGYIFEVLVEGPQNPGSSITNSNTKVPASLKSVTVTGGNIPSNAFINCTGLTSVSIGNGVASIGSSAFRGCTGLTSITILNGVTSIGSSAFYGCTSLTDVYITDPSAWCNISFNGSYANPLEYADNGHIVDAEGEKVTEVILDTSVKEIPAYAFKNCKDLTSIIIPDSVTSIGYSAFSGCTGLTNITIPDGVTSISYAAFSGCTGLTSITIPDRVTSIDGSAFRDCTGLTSITIPDSVTTIGNYAFNNCSGIVNTTIPSSVTMIGTGAIPFGHACFKGTQGQWNGLAYPFSGTVHVNATGEEIELRNTPEGVAIYCKLCDKTLGYAAPAECSHSYGDWVKVDDTDHGKTCALCQDVQKGAHQWDSGVITQRPTYQEIGVKTYTCSVCKGTKTEDIPVLTEVIRPDAIEGEYAEEINLWLKIFVPDSFKENGAYLVMTKQGGFGVETVTVKGSELGSADARGRYLLKMGVASGEMTSKVSYEFYDADGNKLNIVTSSGNNMGDAATFSLLNYAKSMLRSGTDAQKKMVAAMLTYGGYAQKYFGVDAENPAYNLLTELGMTVHSLDGVTADLITDRTIVADGGNGIKATGMQTFLDSAIYLRVYFTLAAGADIDDYKFVLTYAKPDGTVDTMELTTGYEAGKNRYYVDIENIPAAYLDYMYNITVTNTQTNATYSVTTSVMVWMRNALNTATDENHKNLLKAIYLYNQAANEFFGK